MAMVETQEPILLNDEAWERIVRITGGAAAPCFQCGVCTAICPWGLVKDETVSIRKLIRSGQLGLDSGDFLWLCTTCGACVPPCPRGVDIPGVMLALREVAWRERNIPEGFPSMLWSEYWNGNPWERPPSERAGWARGLDLPQYNSAEHEVLLYAGCSASYDRRIQKVARALVSILQAADVKFGILGEDEPCCGDPARSVGHTAYTKMIVDENSRQFEELGVGTIVTVSPHCYDMFKNHYHAGDGFRPLHYSQYLAELVEAERLTLPNELSMTTTFHDPCYLARRNDETEAPRKVLTAIPGMKTVEMTHSAEETICCGGGGGRMWLETAPGERFSDMRVKEGMETGADVMVTACPHCISCLEDSLAVVGAENMRILDLAEVVALTTNGKGAKGKSKSRKKKRSAS